jgi:hypothetical protein
MTNSTVERAGALAELRLASLPKRLLHVAGVARVANHLTSLGVGGPELETAAWLHDIGYAPDLAKTGFHPLDGAQFLATQGFPPIVISLVAYHSGAEMEAEARGLAGALSRIRKPPAALLDDLTFADMTTSPDGKPVEAKDRIAEILSRYPEGDVVHEAVTKSAPNLLAAVERVRSRIDSST